MSPVGLGCAKTPGIAPHVEISPSNCIPKSQIILHTRASMPCWRIVFSTFYGCMSFYTARVNRVASRRARHLRHVRYASDSDPIGAQQRTVAMYHLRLMHRGKIGVSLDHLVGAGEQGRRHLDPQRLGRVEVDGENDFRWLLSERSAALLVSETRSVVGTAALRVVLRTTLPKVNLT